MATLAVWATVGGVTAQDWLNDDPKANGEPLTWTSSIQTDTVFWLPEPLYWVRVTRRPLLHVSDTLGVWAATLPAKKARSSTAATREVSVVRAPPRPACLEPMLRCMVVSR
jgi:hypothetical protein